MSSLSADVKYALRGLRNSPGFAAIAIGTLALGISANTVIFSGVESFILRPLPVPDADRVLFLRQVERNTGASFAIPYADLLDWRAGAPAFSHIAGIRIDTFNLTGQGEAERIRGSRVTAGFFESLGLPPASGRTIQTADDRPGAAPVVVISAGLAERRFGGAGAIGKSVTLDGRAHTIVGVMPAVLRFPMGFSELWTPLARDAASSRGQHELAAIGRLRPAATMVQAREQLEIVTRRLATEYPDANRNMAAVAVPLAEQISRGPRQSILVLWAAVLFVLLICCANLANLMLARSIHRQREFAIRKAVGAGRWQVVRQVLVESALLSGLGGVLGLLFAHWGLDALTAFLPVPMQPIGGLRLNPTVLAFAVALSLATGVVFGLVPALRTLRAAPVNALREGGRLLAGGRAKNRTSTALVIGEVALAVALLTGAGLLLGGLHRMQSAELGFSSDHVLTADLAASGDKYAEPAQQLLVVDRLLGRLRAAPGVEAAAVVNFPPMTNHTSRAYAATAAGIGGAQQPPIADLRVATPQYASVLGIHIVRGRFFGDTDGPNAEPVAVVNSRFANREWPGEEAIGKHVALYEAPGKLGPWRSVVGVVADVRYRGPVATPNPEVYIPYSQQPQSSFYVMVRTRADPGAFAPSLQSITKDIDPDLPLTLVRPMERVISDALAPARLTSGMLAIFAGVALLLAAIGLYGVISYLVVGRSHEFGVRVALGATSGGVLRMVLRRSLGITAAGTTLGLLGASAVSRVLVSLFPGVRPDAVVFAGVAGVLLIVGTAATWYPVHRVLLAGPLEALRHD